ncbi:MAG TPA: TolC family protein [Candidatus Polarisedimenticolia bacterium]|nr:TolC family protein [Candidatus Polarisedimenticolia bacterium]
MTLHWRILAFAAGLAASASEPALPPADLAALLAQAQAANPEIAAAMSLRAAAEAVPSQMEALPDPLASVSYTNETFTEFTLGEREDAVLTLSWTQEVPYPGKRRRAGDAARLETLMRQRRLEGVRLEVASRVKTTFADLYRVDRTAAILQESRKLLVSFLETARTRYETGEGLLQNVLKAQTEVARLDADLETFAQERRSLVASLNALAGRAEDAPLGPARELPGIPGSLDLSGLERDAMERSPEILELQAAVERSESRLELARLQLKPDLMWGAAYMNRGGLDPMIMGMFGMRLPLYRQRKQVQGIVQSTHELDAARRSVDTSHLKLLADVRDLAARADRADGRARLFAEGVIPQARASLESASAAYGVGRVDFLTLLSDFTALLGYEVELVAERAAHVDALARLERLTGRELIQVASPGAGEERGES